MSIYNKVIAVYRLLSTSIAGKVDKVPGKGLSSNDFTDGDKAKLDALTPYGPDAYKRGLLDLSVYTMAPWTMTSAGGEEGEGGDTIVIPWLSGETWRNEDESVEVRYVGAGEWVLDIGTQTEVSAQGSDDATSLSFASGDVEYSLYRESPAPSKIADEIAKSSLVSRKADKADLDYRLVEQVPASGFSLPPGVSVWVAGSDVTASCALSEDAAAESSQRWKLVYNDNDLCYWDEDGLNPDDKSVATFKRGGDELVTPPDLSPVLQMTDRALNWIVNNGRESWKEVFFSYPSQSPGFSRDFYVAIDNYGHGQAYGVKAFPQDRETLLGTDGEPIEYLSAPAEGMSLYRLTEAYQTGGRTFFAVPLKSVEVDDTLSSTSENPVQNKVVKAALDARPTKAQVEEGWWSEWETAPSNYSGHSIAITYYDNIFEWMAGYLADGGFVAFPDIAPIHDTNPEETDLLDFKLVGEDEDVEITATRHRVAAPVPTKPDDIGAQDALTTAQLAAADSGATAAKVTAWDGYAATIAGKADSADLRYAIAEAVKTARLPQGATVLRYDGVPVNYTIDYETSSSGDYWALNVEGGSSEFVWNVDGANGADGTSGYYVIYDSSGSPMATVPDLEFSYLLADRAVNLVTPAAGSSSLSLSLPAQVDGRSRDFYVKVANTGSGSEDIDITVGSASVVDASGAEFPLVAPAGATTTYRLTETANGTESPSADPVFLVAGTGSGGAVEVDDALSTTSENPVQNKVVTGALNGKADSGSIAPAWTSTATYPEGCHVTYLGALYECMAAYTADSSSQPPPDDLYDATATPATGHWKATDLATPDATLDVRSDGLLRLVGADGTLLWQEGYDIKTSAGASPADRAVNLYAFAAADAFSTVTLTLPTPASGKVADLVVDVSNTALDFSESATYAVGDFVYYGGNYYRCTTAVSTAGAWDAANWTQVAAYDPSSTSGYEQGEKAVHDGKLWDCTAAIASGSAAVDFDRTKWNTASFDMAGAGSLSFVVPSGENLADMLTFGPGMCELYFTLTAFGLGGRPTWKVMRSDLEAAS